MPMGEKIFVAALCVVWFWIGVTAGPREQSSFEPQRVARIEQRLGELIQQVDVIGSRVTLLERPREPVMPPRNPGRIGASDTTR